MPVSIHGGAVRGEIFGESLKAGYAVGASYRQRRIEEAAMKEAYGAESIVGARTKQLIEERVKKDAAMLSDLLGSQNQELIKLGTKLWNKHPILGAEPIKYHPKVDLFTTNDAIVEYWRDEETNELQYNMYPLVKGKTLKLGEIIEMEKTLKKTGKTVKITATNQGMDEDGGYIFGDVKVGLSDENKPAPEDRTKALKAEIDTLKAQQEGVQKELSAILGPIKTSNSLAMMFAMQYAETREERDNLVKKFAVSNIVEKLSPENKRKALQLYAALGEVTSQLIQTNPEAFRKMKEEEARQTKELEEQARFDEYVDWAYEAIESGYNEDEVKALFKKKMGKELPKRQ